MVGESLRQLLVRGEGVGAFVGAGARSGRAEHPVCGDQVELSLQVTAGPAGASDRITALRWRASGCPATLAICALAHHVLADVPCADAASVLRRAILAHGGLAAHERHAEAMVLRALAAAGGG
jgi:NifU-like protein involved in Fe-S cluster formation